MTTADGKIAAIIMMILNWVNGMYLCGDKLLLDDYREG